MLQLQQLILFRSRLCPRLPLVILHTSHYPAIALTSLRVLNGDGLSLDRRISPITQPPPSADSQLNRINFDRPVKCQSVRSGGRSHSDTTNYCHMTMLHIVHYTLGQCDSDNAVLTVEGKQLQEARYCFYSRSRALLQVSGDLGGIPQLLISAPGPAPVSRTKLLCDNLHGKL